MRKEQKMNWDYEIIWKMDKCSNIRHLQKKITVIEMRWKHYSNVYNLYNEYTNLLMFLWNKRMSYYRYILHVSVFIYFILLIYPDPG